MARKSQENPELDMTPMIDVVFELIIFFVVTLTEAAKKDETIEVEDGQHGIVLVADEMPPGYMQIDINAKGRISMGNVTMTKEQIKQRVEQRVKRLGTTEFPIMIRADFATEHKYVKDVMDACTAAKVWKLSFVAVGEEKDTKHPRTRLHKLRGK